MLQQLYEADMTIDLRKLPVVIPALLLTIGSGVANAGQTINVASAMACFNDKWNKSERLEKGRRLVDYAGRCVIIPDASDAQNT